MGKAKRETLVARFWSKVNRSGECWIWTGATNGRGYGQINVEGKPAKAHRVAWELTHGPVPAGRHVCHDCPEGDNPLCVNPAHLFLGDHDENMADMARKGRGGTRTPLPGESNPGAKLTWADVEALRERRNTGATYRELAATFGISAQQACAIALGQSWVRPGGSP